MATIPFACTALLLVAPASAWTSWQTNCTVSPKSVNFVTSPDTRGTLDIVWSCLLILITCTWTVQHLSVSLTKPDDELSWGKKFQSAWKSSSLSHWRFFPLLHPKYLTGEERWHKLNWMLFTIFAPEYVLGKALAESSAAYHSIQEMKDLRMTHKIDVPWSTSHGFLANMRGLALRFDVDAVPTDLAPREPDVESRTLHVLTASGDPPYEEQDPHEAERRELVMCQRICGVPCKNRQGTLIATPIQRMARSWPLRQGTEESGRPWLRSMDENAEIVAEPHGDADLERAAAPQKFIRGEMGDHSGQKSPGSGPKSPGSGPKSPGSGPKSPGLRQKSGTPSLGKLNTDMQEVLAPHKTWTGTWALSSAQWHYAYSSGIITQPPGITVADIADKSKSDMLVKIVAVGQILWLVIQICARAVQGLAITLLEITVLSFAACAIVTYLLLLPKPQDVALPFIIRKPGILTRAQVIGLAARAPASAIIVHQFWLHGVAVRSMADNVWPASPYLRLKTPFSRHPLNIHISPVLAGIGAGGAIFGTIHFAAWNFSFPTPAEKTLWHVSCCVIAAMPVLATTLYWSIERVTRRSGKDDTKILGPLKWLGYSFVPFYLAARVYLSVEVFRALAYPVPSTFVAVDWAAMLPHGG